MDRRKIALARCYIFGQAPCTLPELYATFEPKATWACLMMILGVIYEFVDGPRADKSITRCVEGLSWSAVYRLQSVPVHLASGLMLSLKSTQPTTIMSPLDSLTCEKAMYTLSFLHPLQPGPGEEFTHGCPGGVISRFLANILLKMHLSVLTLLIGICRTVAY